jgi:hypothetical protein
MTVDQFAEILQGGELRLVHDGYYVNRFGQCGYRVMYKGPIAYYSYRVSGTETPVAPDEVAHAITHPERNVSRENVYSNRNGQQGFEATVRAGDHSFMLNAAPDPPRF